MGFWDDEGPATRPTPVKGEKKPKKSLKPDAPESPGVQTCIDRFFEAFVSKFNDPAYVAEWRAGQRRTHDLVTPLINGGKHGQQFKKLLASWGAETVLGLIDLFFATSDQQITRSDYTLDYFFAKAQYLRLKHVRRVLDEGTRANLDAAARALRRT